MRRSYRVARLGSPASSAAAVRKARMSLSSASLLRGLQGVREEGSFGWVARKGRVPCGALLLGSPAQELSAPGCELACTPHNHPCAAPLKRHQRWGSPRNHSTHARDTTARLRACTLHPSTTPAPPLHHLWFGLSKASCCTSSTRFFSSSRFASRSAMWALFTSGQCSGKPPCGTAHTE